MLLLVVVYQTDTIFVEENVISDAGTITGTQVICPGDTPLDLINTSLGAASGTISYIWERQAVTDDPNVDPWTRTAVVSTSYFFTGTISESTRFRRVPIYTLYGNSCEGDPTGFVVVTIGTPPAATFTNITTTTICTGDTVQFEATAGGVGPFDYYFYYNGFKPQFTVLQILQRHLLNLIL